MFVLLHVSLHQQRKMCGAAFSLHYLSLTYYSIFFECLNFCFQNSHIFEILRGQINLSVIKSISLVDNLAKDSKLVEFST